jgi:antitoxin (DNA-binding transcriptional repressor) of toxin-antitoxin stability system
MTHLSKLIDAALSGEEFIIAKGNKPAVKGSSRWAC